MVGRRDTGHRGQGDARHGSLTFKDMHKNPEEHVATCMGSNPPNCNWTQPPNCRTKLQPTRRPCNATATPRLNAIPSQAACHSGATCSSGQSPASPDVEGV